MRVKTYDMHVKYDNGKVRHFTNLSRVAVQRYKRYFEDTLRIEMMIVKEHKNEL